MKAEEKYQKCVKDIDVEDGWKKENHPLQPKIVVIHFNFPVYTYGVHYNELRKVLDLLVEYQGIEEVERELGISIKE